MKTRFFIIAVSITATILIAASCAAHTPRQTKQTDNTWSETILAKLDAPARLLADTLSSGQKSGRNTIGVIVSMNEGSEPSCLTDAGFKISADLGTSALVALPTDSLRRLASLPQVKSVSLGTPQTLYNAKIPAMQKQESKIVISPIASPSKDE